MQYYFPGTVSKEIKIESMLQVEAGGRPLDFLAKHPIYGLRSKTISTKILKNA